MGETTITKYIYSLAIWILCCVHKNVSMVNEPDCGLTNPLPKPRILGGRNAMQGEFPWVVRITTKDDKSTLCTGTLLNEEWVIAAAHCMFENKKPLLDKMVVEAGHVDRVVSSRYKRKQTVKKKHVHEKFVPIPSHGFDIALLELEGPIGIKDSNGQIKSACLPNETVASGLVTDMVGWGCLYSGPTRFRAARKLQTQETQISNGSLCMTSGREICVSARHSSYCDHGSCWGDSGGPLLQYQNGKYVVLGVLSYDLAGCFSVFTNLTSFMPWIRKTMKLD